MLLSAPDGWLKRNESAASASERKRWRSEKLLTGWLNGITGGFSESCLGTLQQHHSISE